MPVGRAFLFCHTPGFVSFGKSGEKEEEGRRTLFQHPVIDEDCLATTADSGQEFRDAIHCRHLVCRVGFRNKIWDKFKDNIRDNFSIREL